MIRNIFKAGAIIVFLFSFSQSAYAFETEFFCTSIEPAGEYTKCNFDPISYTQLKVYGGQYPATSTVLFIGSVSNYTSDNLILESFGDIDKWWVLLVVGDDFYYINTPASLWVLSGITLQTSPAPPPAETVFLTNPVEFSGAYNNFSSYNVLEVQATSTAITVPVIFSLLSTETGTGLPYLFYYDFPATGSYTGRARLWSSELGEGTPWVYLGAFALGSTTSSIDLITGTSTIPIITCEDRGFIGNTFCEVITWAFVPSQSSFDRFKNLRKDLEKKPPFGYFSAVLLPLQNIASTSPAVTLAYTSAISAVLTPIKGGIIILLWVLFGYWIFHRIRLFDFHL